MRSMSEGPWTRRPPLAGTTILVTGITDGRSLAVPIARELRAQGAAVVCAGLGPTPHHGKLSPRAASFLDAAWTSFQHAVTALGPDVAALPFDVKLDASIAAMATELSRRGIGIDGLVHAIALDPTIRRGTVAPMLDVTREQFLQCLEVSAYSLLALVRSLLEQHVLRHGASVVTLSYIGAARVPSHPYRNIAVAKAALERLALELADEIGRTHAVRVNTVRFSPWSASRAGGAIGGLADAMHAADERSPLGNATPEDLAREVAHLLRPSLRVTGEVRHVDGGFHGLA